MLFLMIFATRLQDVQHDKGMGAGTPAARSKLTFLLGAGQLEG